MEIYPKRWSLPIFSKREVPTDSIALGITADVESSQRFVSSQLEKNRLYLSYTQMWLIVESVFV